MSIFDKIGIDVGYIVILEFFFIFVLFILFMIQKKKNDRMITKYNRFMMSGDGKSIEKELQTKFKKVSDVVASMKDVEERIEELEDKMSSSYQKMGLVKYDAFKEMGGSLSFSLSLLNDENTGIVVTSMHSREGCYTYIKEIIRGESYVLLSDEEKQAIKDAIGNDMME